MTARSFLFCILLCVPATLADSCEPPPCPTCSQLADECKARADALGPPYTYEFRCTSVDGCATDWSCTVEIRVTGPDSEEYSYE